jgi:hypothetical protein
MLCVGRFILCAQDKSQFDRWEGKVHPKWLTQRLIAQAQANRLDITARCVTVVGLDRLPRGLTDSWSESFWDATGQWSEV